MGHGHPLAAQDETPGNPARRDMLAALAEVQARERAGGL
jgi:hypothetical protein